MIKNKILEATSYMKPKISVRILSQVAILVALAVVLERVIPAINLPLVRISFAFIPMMICGMLFGPVLGAIAFGIVDLLGWPIMGLAPIPLILLSRIVNGFLFGLFLHRDKLKVWPHAVVNAFSVEIICAMGLTTLGLTQIFGTPYFALLWTRMPQFVIFIIMQIAIFPVLLKLREALLKSGYVYDIKKSAHEH